MLDISRHVIVARRYLSAFSSFPAAFNIEYCIEPPIPMPVPSACNIETTGKTTLIAVIPASPTLLPTKYPSTIEYMPERANARIDGITKRKNFFEYIKIPISKIFFI